MWSFPEFGRQGGPDNPVGLSGCQRYKRFQATDLVTGYSSSGVATQTTLNELSDSPDCSQGWPDNPVLLCTATGLELSRQTLAEEYGVTDLLFKPVSPRQLVSTVLELVPQVTAS